MWSIETNTKFSRLRSISNIADNHSFTLVICLFPSGPLILSLMHEF